LKEEAKKHLHLTVFDAAKIAKKARVDKLFLIHVGSRYLKNMKSFLKESKDIFEKSYLPRDLDIFVLK
jgi:ribonuclease BN (tRNA processing enzyme)